MATKDITDKQVCQSYKEYQDEISNNNYGCLWPYERLMQQTGECLKVCYRACERADDRGYIEYGVSLRSGWLTDKGKELLTSGC